MTMWNGNWNDDNCGTEMQFLCQLFLDDSHPKPTGDESWPSSGNCQPGWTRFAKGCYKASFDECMFVFFLLEIPFALYLHF